MVKFERLSYTCIVFNLMTVIFKSGGYLLITIIICTSIINNSVCCCCCCCFVVVVYSDDDACQIHVSFKQVSLIKP